MRWLLVLQVIATPVSAATYSIASYYLDNACTSNVSQVHAVEASNCTATSCGASSSSDGSDVESIECSTDYATSMINTLGAFSSYVIVARFEDASCSSLYYAYATTQLGSCVENMYQGGFSVVMLGSDGSASIQYFSDASCLTPYASVSGDSAAVLSHECSASNYVWYTSDGGATAADPSAAGSMDSDNGMDGDGSKDSYGPEASSSPHSSALIPLTVGCLVLSSVVLALVAWIVVLYRRLKQQPPVATQSGLWDDDIITATRIPRSKVCVKKLLCRGAFGEVYCGVFNKQKVAVKMLLPATRTDLEHVNEFLTEAKMTAMMDHPHIVYFIGVAWDSLSDLCIVMEFMDNADLRTLLSKYEAERHPVGFDKQKAGIALHICHALTYLHSLASPVIHRDLKSRNVLLNQALTAKLTDFGISRERLDRTMTAGVGTSLWMAPEVMLGEKYGVKADMFSFGVVLSELDVHTMPYTRLKQTCREMEGRELGDATLLQRVSTGEVSVEFSYMSPSSFVDLGRACVSIDPRARPSAAEALYRLQVILARDLS
jgi:serine/threonine-protein kinase TNNI3K